MPKNNKGSPIQGLLTDESLPPEHRVAMLKDLVNSQSPEAQAIVLSILDGVAAAGSESLYAEKSKRLAELLRQMNEGPLRSATFIQMMTIKGSNVPQALVVFDDGTQACTPVPDEELPRTLRRGDRVMIEGKGHALLSRVPNGIKVGEEARLERCIDDWHVEVTVRGEERAVFLASEELINDFKAGKIEPGVVVVTNPRQAFAYYALPPQDGLAHYQFLARVPVPNVIVERDIGAPPQCIGELSHLIRMEMTNPDLRRRYKLRRCVMKLLAGVSGSGKTLAVLAIHRRMYEIMSELTGVPIEKLPPRVFKLRSSQVLSKWFGESDQRIDRFFDEIEQMANEPFVVDGKELHLPVLAILEEVDGLAKARGSEPIYDRILTTALQRLDPTREELKDKLIIFIATTNEAHQVDRAFLRRAGGTTEQFGRLNRKAFRAVLQKHVQGLPVASNNGCTQEELWRKLINDVTAWLFSPNGSDQGVVELTYAGSTTPAVKHRRDFLTGALVDRAVQQAADEAVKAEDSGTDHPGVTHELLVRAFDEQIRSTVDLLREHNAGSYLDLPDGVRVATVRRIPQPAHLQVEFQRSE